VGRFPLARVEKRLLTPFSLVPTSMARVPNKNFRC